MTDSKEELTSFQLEILSAFPAGNESVKKELRSLPFFIIRKILKIENPRSIRNLKSSLKCLIHKGCLVKKDNDIYSITDEGIELKKTHN